MQLFLVVVVVVVVVHCLPLCCVRGRQVYTKVCSHILVCAQRFSGNGSSVYLLLLFAYFSVVCNLNLFTFLVA